MGRTFFDTGKELRFNLFSKVHVSSSQRLLRCFVRVLRTVQLRCTTVYYRLLRCVELDELRKLLQDCDSNFWWTLCKDFLPAFGNLERSALAIATLPALLHIRPSPSHSFIQIPLIPT